MSPWQTNIAERWQVFKLQYSERSTVYSVCSFEAWSLSRVGTSPARNRRILVYGTRLLSSSESCIYLDPLFSLVLKR